MATIEWAITVGSVCISLITAWGMWLKKKYDVKDRDELKKENEELRKELHRRG